MSKNLTGVRFVQNAMGNVVDRGIHGKGKSHDNINYEAPFHGARMGPNDSRNAHRQGPRHSNRDKHRDVA